MAPLNMITNGYQVSVTGGSSASLTYDLNGNMTSDGTNSYSWDACDRLIKITYPGTGNNTQFLYSPWGKFVSIVETVSGTVNSTKQFVWCGSYAAEARNATSAIVAQYYALGQTISGSKYYYTADHLQSVREMTDTSGTIQAQYSYDPFGRTLQIQGTLSSDSQYAGYYFHAASGLNLTVYRAYNPNLGRFINRDPIEEFGGINLYGYAGNSSANFTDPSGLVMLSGGVSMNAGGANYSPWNGTPMTPKKDSGKCVEVRDPGKTPEDPEDPEDGGDGGGGTPGHNNKNSSNNNGGGGDPCKKIKDAIANVIDKLQHLDTAIPNNTSLPLLPPKLSNRGGTVYGHLTKFSNFQSNLRGLIMDWIHNNCGKIDPWWTFWENAPQPLPSAPTWWSEWWLKQPY